MEIYCYIVTWSPILYGYFNEGFVPDGLGEADANLFLILIDELSRSVE